MTVAALLVALAGGGCRTSTGPGLHVGVRVEPPPGYRPPMISPRGEVFSYGAEVEPRRRPPQTAPAGPGGGLIDYRRLGGIVVWIEPVGGRAPSGGPPLNAQVDLASQQRANFEHVHLASVGGRVSFMPASPGPAPAGSPPAFVLRTAGGEVLDASGPVFVPDRPGHYEVLTATHGDPGEPLAHVYVAPTASARRVRNGERVTFAPIPPGRYRVSTWHPVLRDASQVVEVTAGPLVKVTVTVAAKPHPESAPQAVSARPSR